MLSPKAEACSKVKRDIKTKFKRIFNPPEKLTYELLSNVCGSNVYPKFRVADVLPIEGSGISDREFEYALKSHFDFLIADDNDDPQFAVEFDGLYHLSGKQKQRDLIKDSLVERFQFPMLRVGLNEITKKYRDLDLLTYFVEIWYNLQAFLDAQKQGIIPLDEIFDPTSIICTIRENGKTCRSRHFPYWLSLDARVEIKKLYESNRITEPIPYVYVGLHENRKYFGLSIIRIDSNNCVISEFSLKSQHFPIILSDVIEEVLVHDIYDRLLLALDNPKYSISLEKAKKRLEAYKKHTEPRLYGGLAGIYEKK